MINPAIVVSIILFLIGIGMGLYNRFDYSCSSQFGAGLATSSIIITIVLLLEWIVLTLSI